MIDKNKETDFVIAWVDGNDKKWQEEKRRWNDASFQSRLSKWNEGESRYRDWDILRYWFRGVEKYSPWVRQIYFVTYGHIPEWLDTSNNKIKIVRHEDFIPLQYLPTFNSHTIELNLHRIEGLSDHFVYFNDDMFLTDNVKKEDFFNQGLPCDCPIVNPVQMIQNGIRAEINDMYIINDHFNKKEVIRNNLAGWYNLKYGPLLVRTFLMIPYHTFPGFYIHHLPTSFLKRSFMETWEKNEDVLNETCMHKFRTSTDVNQWLIQYWQYCKNNFYPRSWKFGKMFEGKDVFSDMCNAIKMQKYKVVCCNDSLDIDNEEFITKKILLKEAFDSILKTKSSFEKG